MGAVGVRITGFNPTLVRLRHGCLSQRGRSVIQFQSHAGSIEAEGDLIDSFFSAEFQSHAGSIEADLCRNKKEVKEKFQSHAGSIEARARLGLPPRLFRVSIPRWFD